MMKFLRIATLLMSAMLLVLAGCKTDGNEKNTATESANETVGAWVTYSEIDGMVNSPQGFSMEFTLAVENMRALGINTVYFHTVAFCDAVYLSEIYPQRHPQEGDILATAVDICKAAGIELHAWINPYRVQSSSADPETLPEGFVKVWLSDDNAENDGNVCFTDNGIYLNPASSEVRGTVISAVREMVANYNVSGIHFDDYFYPVTSAEFDESYYRKYESGAENPLTLEEWRRTNVNTLLLGCYGAVKAHNKNLKFGVSPAADLDRCYNTLYADIEGWMGGGYIDYIIPQIYFGFQYPAERFQFENLLVKWMDLTQNNGVDLIIGLAMYKSGTDQQPDSAEWQSDNTIIARQIKSVRDNKLSGFVFFSYSSLFSENAANAEQLKSIREIL